MTIKKLVKELRRNRSLIAVEGSEPYSSYVRVISVPEDFFIICDASTGEMLSGMPAAVAIKKFDSKTSFRLIKIKNIYAKKNNTQLAE